MQNHRKNRSLPLEDLRLITYCPLCHTHFNPLEAKILDEKGDSHLLHMECRGCHSSIVVLVLASELGVSSVGLVTDLKSDEVIKFKNLMEISCDDVLSVYKELNQKENFLAVF